MPCRTWQFRPSRGVDARNLEIRSPICILLYTMSSKPSPVNQRKLTQLQAILAELLGEALQRGFHGTAAVELCVQDGTIQHIRRRLERIER
jgi:hypothetical protein